LLASFASSWNYPLFVTFCSLKFIFKYIFCFSLISFKGHSHIETLWDYHF
jgi:hypothetical protein